MAELVPPPLEQQLAQDPNATLLPEPWPPAHWPVDAPPLLDQATLTASNAMPPIGEPGTAPSSAPPAALQAPTVPGLGIPQGTVDTAPAIPPDAPVVLPPLQVAPQTNSPPASPPAFGSAAETDPRSSALGVPLAIPPSDPLTKGGAERDADTAERVRVAALSDEDLAKEQATRDEQARQYAAKATAERATQDLYDARAQLAVHQVAQQKTMADLDDIQARAKVLANGSVESNRWWNSRSLGQKAGGFMAAIFGGLASPEYGGRNGGLDFIEKQNEADASAQRSTLDHQRETLGLRHQVAQSRGDLEAQRYKDETVQRLAAYDRMGQLIQAQALSLDPQGSAYRAGQLAYRDVKARQAKVAAEADQRIFEHHIQDGALALNQKKEKQAATDKKRELDLTAWGHALTARGQDFAAKQHDEDRLDKKLDREAAREAKLDEKDSPTVLDPVTNKPMLNADGTPLLIKDKDTHARVTKMLAGQDVVNKMANQLAVQIREWGGQSDLAKSAKYQKMKADTKALVMGLHEAYGIDSFRPGTAEQLLELAADADPTSFLHDYAPGILRARDNVNTYVGATLKRSAGYTGENNPVDTTQFVDAVLTPDDEDLQEVLSSPFRKPQYQAFRDYDLDASTPEAYAKSLEDAGIPANDPQHVVDQLAAKMPVPPRYAAIIDRMADTMGGLVQTGEQRVGDKVIPVLGPAKIDEQRDAAKRLAAVAQGAALPAVKEYANQALLRTMSAAVPAGVDDANSAPETETAHEKLPPPRPPAPAPAPKKKAK